MTIIHGVGYRMGNRSRVIGESTSHPEGYVVFDTRDNHLYKVSGGVWTDGGTFPNSNFTQVEYDVWLLC